MQLHCSAYLNHYTSHGTNIADTHPNINTAAQPVADLYSVAIPHPYSNTYGNSYAGAYSNTHTGAHDDSNPGPDCPSAGRHSLPRI